METFTLIWNSLVSLGMIGIGIATLFLLITRFTGVFSYSKIEAYLSSKKLLIITLLSWIGMIGSLVYSNIIGFPPCWLCWLQRIAIYPIAILGLVGILRNEATILPYIRTLAIIGIVIAGYHVFTYYTGLSPLPCDANATCTARYVYEFGFVTIPFMSLSAFVFLAGALISAKQALKQRVI